MGSSEGSILDQGRWRRLKVICSSDIDRALGGCCAEGLCGDRGREFVEGGEWAECATCLDGIGVSPLEQSDNDRSFDHVAGDNTQRNPSLCEVWAHGTKSVLAGSLTFRDRDVLGGTLKGSPFANVGTRTGGRRYTNIKKIKSSVW